jgi:hypothetical protein
LVLLHIGMKKLIYLIILSACSTLGRDQWPITLPHPIWLSNYRHTPLIGICGTIFPSATTPSYMIEQLYTYPINWNVWDHFSICQWCPPNLVNRKLFQPTDHVPVHSNGPLGGNQTHDLRLTIPDPGHSASGLAQHRDR